MLYVTINNCLKRVTVYWQLFERYLDVAVSAQFMCRLLFHDSTHSTKYIERQLHALQLDLRCSMQTSRVYLITQHVAFLSD